VRGGGGEGLTCLTDIALVLNPEMSAVDVLLQVAYNNKGCHENIYTFSIGKISDEQCAGSGYTGPITFWAFRIQTRNIFYGPGTRCGSFNIRAKKLEKNLIS
jgi:hypothetical protein